MGFTLTIAPASAILPEYSRERFAKWLASTRQVINDDAETIKAPSSFPFETTRMGMSEASKKIIVHAEVAWDWWPITCQQMCLAIGQEKTKHSSFMNPEFGVAVPFEIPNRHLTKEVMLGGKLHQRLLARLLMSWAPKDPKDHDAFFSPSGKIIRNLRMTSAPAILNELDAACRAWGLPDDEESAQKMAEEMYEAWPETDEAVARCYALIVRSFLRFAVENRCLAWFMK